MTIRSLKARLAKIPPPPLERLRSELLYERLKDLPIEVLRGIRDEIEKRKQQERDKEKRLDRERLEHRRVERHLPTKKPVRVSIDGVAGDQNGPIEMEDK